jgi:hypothetical protein
MALTNTTIYINNLGGTIWTLGDAMLPSFGSFGQFIQVTAEYSSDIALTSQLTCDLGLFLNNTDPHPNDPNAARGFSIDTTSIVALTAQTMQNYGNDSTRTNGICQLTFLNIDKKSFRLRWNINLVEDINDWMHSLLTTSIPNDTKFASYGSPSAYETIKNLGIYVSNQGFSAQENVDVTFNQEEKSQFLGTPTFNTFDAKIYVSAVEQTSLQSGVDNDIEITFKAPTLAPTLVETQLINNSDLVGNQTPQDDFKLKSYYDFAPALVSGTTYKASFTIPSADIETGKSYSLLPIPMNGASSTSTSITKASEKHFIPCLPHTEVYWKSYLNTNQSSKIDIAPYERMAVEFKVYHDTYPTETPPSPSYYDCIADQGYWNPNFVNSFQTLTLPLFDGSTHTFTKVNGIITPQNTLDEYETGTYSGNEYSIFRVFFRSLENDINQLHGMDITMVMNFYELVFVGSTVVYNLVVQQSIVQPLEARISAFENDNGGVNITDMNVYDENGVLSNNAMCVDNEFFEVIAESADLDYEVQALLVKPNIIAEEELFNSVQSESYFDTQSTNRIYDLEGDFTTGGDCSFKVVNDSTTFNKIIVIACK